METYLEYCVAKGTGDYGISTALAVPHVLLVNSDHWQCCIIRLSYWLFYCNYFIYCTLGPHCTGPPGRPKGPVEVLDVQKDSAKISWNPPDDDGGKPITLVVTSCMKFNWCICADAAAFFLDRRWIQDLPLWWQVLCPCSHLASVLECRLLLSIIGYISR